MSLPTDEQIDAALLDQNLSFGQVISQAVYAAVRSLIEGRLPVRPPYPTGIVVGPCVCGSWPGGECLKCEWRAAGFHAKPEGQSMLAGAGAARQDDESIEERQRNDVGTTKDKPHGPVSARLMNKFYGAATSGVGPLDMAPPSAGLTPWDAKKHDPEAFARVCRLANECNVTQSLLYDLNLLPEQTLHDPVRWFYTANVVHHVALAKRNAASPQVSEPAEGTEGRDGTWEGSSGQHASAPSGGGTGKKGT